MSRIKNFLRIFFLKYLVERIARLQVKVAENYLASTTGSALLSCFTINFFNLVLNSGFLGPVRFAQIKADERLVLSGTVPHSSTHKIDNRTLQSMMLVLLHDKTLSRNAKNISIDPVRFSTLLASERLSTSALHDIARELQIRGQVQFTAAVYQRILDDNLLVTLSVQERFAVLKESAIAFFLVGNPVTADRFWKQAATLRGLISPGSASGPQYRVLSGAWFVAVGHVAALAYFLKYQQLFRYPQFRIVVTANVREVPGKYLLGKLARAGINFIDAADLESDYDTWAQANHKMRWGQLSQVERDAMIDDFWFFEFPDGETLGFTNALNKIETEWERQQLPAIFQMQEEDNYGLQTCLRAIGLPVGAWYICLHVRGPGFHRQWNALHPALRDANIDDYALAIELVRKAGGWIIRVGDNTMPPLPPGPNVIDYAHSSFKTPDADILIPLGCKFFLGTNSGYATVPAIFGVRCILTNWVPIGWPLWGSKNLMMPKLFYRKSTNSLMSLRSVFDNGLAFLQTVTDLPEDIILKDNTPEDIRDLAAEALGLALKLEPEVLNEYRFKYSELVIKANGFVGATLCATTIHKYKEALFES